MNLRKILITFMSLLLLPACGPADVRFFPPITTNPIEKAGVRLTVHVMSPTECYDYFGCDVAQEADCQPLLLKIENVTCNHYMLKPSYVPLARISGREVAELMHYDTYQRVFWTSFPALIFWWPAIPFLIVPYGIGCSHYNKKVTRLVRKKTLGAHDTLTIAPYETVQRFVFVPSAQIKQYFTIKLYNETEKKLEEFPVNLLMS